MTFVKKYWTKRVSEQILSFCRKTSGVIIKVVLYIYTFTSKHV